MTSKTEKYLDQVRTTRADLGAYYGYAKVDYRGQGHKITLDCPVHGEFIQRPRDHLTGSGCRKCGREKYKVTCLARYGAENPFQSEELKAKLRATNLDRYGCENPSGNQGIKDQKLATREANYGPNPYSNPETVARMRATSLARYGVEHPQQNKRISAASTATRMRNGWQTVNSSKEATLFFREYRVAKGYTPDQVCYADKEAGLHEWGYQIDGKWALFDFAAFTPGHRGDPEHLVEVAEYQGPFHYTDADVEARGDDRAFPWKNKTLTIRESRDKDVAKERFATDRGAGYTAIKPDHYHKPNG